MAVIAYVLTGLAVTVGYHRGFTHRSFKARRGLRIALAIGGSLAVEGSPVQWVANHRRHHAFSDREGDPHSPWRYGTDTRALLKGMVYAHVGWMLKRELSNRARFAPDLLADRDLRPSGGSPGPDRGVAAGACGPRRAGHRHLGRRGGGILLGRPDPGGAAAPCHLVGELRLPRGRQAAVLRPGPRDQLLAAGILSFGESWHNSHHADPTAARHGTLPGR